MISLLDWFVILIYAGVVIAFGFLAGKKESTAEDFFLGGRKMPWLSVMISIYATSLSALTFIGVPGAAFEGDFVYYNTPHKLDKKKTFLRCTCHL